jgi:hypothetical protein
VTDSAKVTVTATSVCTPLLRGRRREAGPRHPSMQASPRSCAACSRSPTTARKAASKHLLSSKGSKQSSSRHLHPLPPTPTPLYVTVKHGLAWFTSSLCLMHPLASCEVISSSFTLS